jgi:hypothetical protein
MLLLVSLLLLRGRDVLEMSAVNGVSAAVDIMLLPSLVGDSAVIRVPAVAGVPVLYDFCCCWGPCISGLRTRIHFIRVQIQHLRMNTNPDPDPIRIQGFND